MYIYSSILATFFEYFTGIGPEGRGELLKKKKKKRTNSLSDESRVILSLYPYFLKFHYKFKVNAKNFLLETFSAISIKICNS